MSGTAVLYLSLSVLISTLLFATFRLFTRFKVDNQQAIIINYIVASLTGLLFAEEVSLAIIWNAPWLFPALFMGLIFVFLFNVMALASQRNGISVASVANKMSVIIPVIAAIWLYDDQMPFLKVIGIMTALVGIWLVFLREEVQPESRSGLVLPIILFIGSGFIDTYLKYIEYHYLGEGEFSLFSAVIFGTAACTGFLFRASTTRKVAFVGKNVLWGGILGIINFGSIFFILKALDIPGLESSKVFPVNNMGIVALSAIASFLFFKERISIINWVGILVSIIAIGLIAVS